MDFSQYFNSNTTDLNDEAITAEADALTEPENQELTVEVVKEFCERLTGKLPSGESKAAVAYQSYKINEKNEFSPESEQIYALAPSEVTVSYDEIHPDLLMLTLRFSSSDDPSLRLFWRRLTNFREDLARTYTNEKYNIFIFFIHLLEKESLGSMHSKETNPELLEINITNPLIEYLTRYSPTDIAIETTGANDEKVGGNVVKLLLDINNVDFIKRNDVNVSMIKAESLRESLADRYE